MRRLALIVFAAVAIPGAAAAQTYGQPYYGPAQTTYGQPYGGPVVYGHAASGYGGGYGQSYGYGSAYGYPAQSYGDPRAYRPPVQYGYGYDRADAMATAPRRPAGGPAGPARRDAAITTSMATTTIGRHAGPTTGGIGIATVTAASGPICTTARASFTPEKRDLTTS